MLMKFVINFSKLHKDLRAELKSYRSLGLNYGIEW